MVIGLPQEGLSPAWERDFASYPPAGVIVFRRDFGDLENLRHLTRRLRDLARPRRLFVTIDEEGGLVSQISGHLVVPPSALLLSRGSEPGDVEWTSRVTGERLRALGIDWVFAPVADIHSEPRNPVIGPRSFGTRPDEVVSGVAESVRGLRAAGVASCLKHFPGHGDTALDSHLALPVCSRSRDELEQREIAPFRANLDAAAVMTAHVVYPALDPERPATFSPAIAGTLLRETLGYTGVSITDALEMQGASSGRSPADTGRAALQAGCDLLLFATYHEDVRRARLELAKLLVDGAIDREHFDAARPRLAKLDRDHPEPGEELNVPFERLTPDAWEPRLERIVERGIEVRGARAAAAAGWRYETLGELDRVLVEDVRALLRDEIVAAGWPLGNGADTARVVVHASRVAPDSNAVAQLRAATRNGPLVLVALGNDAFLDEVPEAAVRVSACDTGPITRRVVARELAQLHRAAAPAQGLGRDST